MAVQRLRTGRSSQWADDAGSGASDYWLSKAALLDPDAFVAYSGAFDIVVPPGEFWFLLSSWFLRINNVEFSTFHRTPAYGDLPCALPVGTRLKNGAIDNGSVYVCQPALVAGNPGYDNPRALYEERMGVLLTLPTQILGIHFNTPGTPPDTTYEEWFPPHFEKAIIRQANSENFAWTALFGPGTNGDTLGLPLATEISDHHQLRIGEAMFLPIKRSVTPRIKSATANVSGNDTDPSYIDGVFGTVLYQELPEIW